MIESRKLSISKDRIGSANDDLANFFLNFLDRYNNDLETKDKACLTANILLDALHPYVEMGHEEYSYEPPRTKLSMDELIKRINELFTDKVFRQRLVRGSQLADKLSRFFEFYQHEFYKLHPGIQVKLTLNNEYELTEKRLCTQIKKILSKQTQREINLNEEMNEVGDIIDIQLLIAHCFEVLKKSEKFSFQAAFVKSESGRAYELLTSVQLLIPISRRAEYVDILLAHLMPDPYEDGHHENKMQYQAIMDFIPYIPIQKVSWVIDQLIPHLADAKKMFSTGCVPVLTAMRELISTEQCQKIISITLSHIENTHSNLAAQYLWQFTQHLTEADLLRIKTVLEQIGEAPVNYFKFATCAYLAMALPDTEKYQCIRQNIGLYKQKLFNALRLRLIKGNLYKSASDEDESYPTYMMSQHLLGVQDLLTTDQKMRLLNLVVSRVKNINDSYHAHPDHHDLKLMMQFLLLKPFYPIKTYLAEDFLPYAEDEEELKQAETTGTEEKLVCQTYDTNFYKKTYHFTSDTFYKIEPGEINVWALAEKFTAHLTEVILQNQLKPSDYENLQGAMMIHLCQTLPAAELITIQKSLNSHWIYQFDKLILNTLLKRMQTVTYHERVQLIAALQNQSESPYVKMDKAILLILALHLQQQALLALQQTPQAQWDRKPSHLPYPVTALHHSSACKIQSMFRAHKARNKLHELKEEKRMGLQKWAVYHNYKENLKSGLKFMSECIDKDDMQTLQQTLHNFFGSASSVSTTRAIDYANIPALTEVEKKRFGLIK